jgi:hypothetical protein
MARATAVLGKDVLGKIEWRSRELRVIVANREERAVLNLPAAVSAHVDGLLKERHVPACYEVTMVAVSSGIPVAKHELAVVVNEVRDSKDRLEEDGWDADLEAFRTRTVAHHDGRVGHMRFVIRGIQVLAVPAVGEE